MTRRVFIDEIIQIIQTSAAIVFCEFLSVLVDEQSWESIDFLISTKCFVVSQSAVDFSDFDASISNEFGGQVIPGVGQALAMSAPWSVIFYLKYCGLV